MNAESPRQSSFLCAPWSGIPVAPWFFSLLVLALLAAMRFYAVFGPPWARILFLIHFLAMWALAVHCSHRAGTAGDRPPHAGQQPVRPGPQRLGRGLRRICGLCRRNGALRRLARQLVRQHPRRIPDCPVARSMPLAAAFAAIVLPAMIVSPIGEEILFRGLLQQSFALPLEYSCRDRRQRACLRPRPPARTWPVARCGGFPSALCLRRAHGTSHGWRQRCLYPLPPAHRLPVCRYDCPLGLQHGHDWCDLLLSARLIHTLPHRRRKD